MLNNYVEVFVPGRLCILGEHSDWAAGYRTKNQKLEKGYAIVAGLNLGIYLKGWKSTSFHMSTIIIGLIYPIMNYWHIVKRIFSGMLFQVPE